MLSSMQTRPVQFRPSRMPCLFKVHSFISTRNLLFVSAFITLPTVDLISWLKLYKGHDNLCSLPDLLCYHLVPAFLNPQEPHHMRRAWDFSATMANWVIVDPWVFHLGVARASAFFDHSYWGTVLLDCVLKG